MFNLLLKNLLTTSIMAQKNSNYKLIFEDDSLSDLQKYKKICNLQNKSSRFWTFVIGLNAIAWTLLFIIPNVEVDSQRLNPVVAFNTEKLQGY